MVWPLKEILYVISGLVSVIVVLNHLYWWQTKEYRLDRMLTWIRYDRGWKEVLALKRRRPQLTQRVLVIACLSFLSLIFIINSLYFSSTWLVGILILPLMAALVIVLSTAMSAPLTSLVANQEINRAQARVKQIQPKIIAITGSFGKSSSKDFLATLLSALFRVIKTQVSENTPLGIARRINVSLKPDTDLLILEMGAYKRGEIRHLASLFPPQISWITAIGPQHIGLFGSLENIKLAKYEIVHALTENGIAIMSVDSSDEKGLVNLAKKEKLKVLTYSLKNNPAIIHGTVTEKTDQSFKLTVTESENEWSVTVPLRGEHYAANVLGAIAIARHLKINRDQIIARISKLKQPPQQLTTKKLENGVTLIDNSYNTNFDGFSASVEYLKTFPGRHFVVTPGIIELGKYSQKIHHELGKKLGIIDRIWVTNSKHAQEMNSPDNHVVGEENMEKLFTEVKGTIKKGDALLIEGRIPESLKSQLLKL